MRSRRRPVQWYHTFFPSRAIARYHAECIGERGVRERQAGGYGRVVKLRRNGAGWEVCWRYKLSKPVQQPAS